MAGNKYNGDSNHHHIPPGRVERLLRERELRKSGISGIQSSNNNQMGDVYLEQDQHKNDVTSSSSSSIVTQRQHEDHDVVGKYKQRLLVVANRLPVSANRTGEDSWSLEISAGGLVSALLGMHVLISIMFFYYYILFFKLNVLYACHILIVSRQLRFI